MNLPKSLERTLGIATKTNANVLIIGETGVGKSSLARMIHQQHERRSRPFVVVNLASLYEGTLESELFGHERGAFTGADLRRVGRLEQAQGGTVFLDEVGELSPRLQCRLLEFLQSRKVTPLGGSREVKLDVRVIAATNRDLEADVKRGLFRADLLHRLRVLELRLPSLNERFGDFDLIIHDCLSEICRTTGRRVHKLSEAVAARLECYAWPGNFRELRNVLEFAVLANGEAESIELSHLPDWFLEKSGPSAAAREVGDCALDDESMRLLGVAEFAMNLNFYDTIARFEKDYLERALRRFQGRINRTARSIGMSKATLIRRLRAHGIRPDQCLDFAAQNSSGDRGVGGGRHRGVSTEIFQKNPVALGGGLVY